MAHILVDTTVCVCWTELGQKLPWNKTVKIWKYLKVKISVSVSVSVYLFARKKKTHIHTDIQYITKMLLKD